MRGIEWRSLPLLNELQDAQHLPPHLTTSQRTKPQIEQRPKSNKKFPINKCQDVCYLIRYPRAPGQ